MSLSIAIVGAGPSGFYAAAALLKTVPGCRIDILEALPTPYGLVRAGVAPDHQSTKAVARSFARTAGGPQVAYFGNLVLGRDVSLGELRAIYDAVVLAVGAPLDRVLGIPGADLPGAYGAAAFVGWYNAHPDFRELDPGLQTRAVCVIGHGNVAIDVARVLAKSPAEMAASDLPDYAARAIHQAPIEDIYMIGRRGPLEAKFTNKELSEMGDLAEAVPVVDPADLPEAVTGDMSDRDRRLRAKNLATLRAFAARRPEEKPKRVHILFYAKPVAVLGEGRVSGLRLERTRVEDGRAVGTGETFDIPCGVVVSAIGYRMHPVPGLPIDEGSGTVRHDRGRVAEGLYVVGWAKRGPTGVIGTNKADGDLAAEQIRADRSAGAKPGRPALERLLKTRRIRWVSFAEWERIEAAEVAGARPGAPRRKLTRIKDMLDLLEPEMARLTKT